jgi:integrase/recombinase XerD
MKQFESFIKDKLEEFIVYRENLGFKSNNVRYSLRHLDRYIVEKTATWDELTPRFFLDFQNWISGENRTVNTIFSASHMFFKFLVRQEYFAENLLQDIPSKSENRFIPFIFTPEEVEQLLVVIQQRIRKTETWFLRDYTVYMALLLLSRCGLRISEPLRLSLSSYRPKEGTIYIENTKFHKDRLIPMPQAVATEIDNYLLFRLHCGDKNNRYLFPGITKGRGLTVNHVYAVFYKAVKEIGKTRKKYVIGTTTFGAPTVHSMRHSFAVNTLKEIKLRGDNPQKALPVLAAYMGHRKYRYTSLYLKMLDAEHRNNLVDFTISHQEER